ncbi:MAG TPA: hypothetical protein VGF08_04725 [Terriglobales bacterium]|jgi:translation elongation factor EF-G
MAPNINDQGESTVVITVPEQFAGFAMGELRSSSGVIVNLNANQGTVTIDASLPGSRLEELAKIIAAATGGQGKVVRSDR